MNKQNINYFRATLPFLMVTTAFLLGALQASMVKAVSQSVPFVMVVFILYAVCLLFYMPLLIRTRLSILKSNRIPLLVTRALAGLALWFGIYYSVKYISLVDSTLLVNLSPAWVPIIAWFALKKPIKKRLYLGLIGGFIGAALILRPDHAIIQWAAFAAFAGGFFMAVTLVAVKELMKTEKSSRIVIYYFLVNTLVLLPFAIKYWTIPSLTVLMLMIGNAICMIIHMELINWGFSLGSASKLSFLTYAGVLFSALLGFLFFGEIPTSYTIMGGILICISGIYVLSLNLIY